MVKGVFYGWWIVLASFFIAFYVAGNVFYGFTAFFEPIVEEYGWSYTQVSIASSLRGLEMGILAPLIGFFVDRFGSRKLAIFGVITTGFGLILLSLTNSLVIFYSACLLLALGAGGCTGLVLYAAVANWFRKKVGKALGIVSCGFGASGVLIPLIVWLIDVYDWQTALVIIGLGMWALGIPLSLIIRDKPEQYGYLPDGEVVAEPIPNPEAQEPEVEVSFQEMLKGKSLWLISLAEATRFIILSAVVIHVMPYLSSIGISRTNAALVATAIPLLSLVGRFVAGWLGDIYNKKYLMAGTYCLIGMGMLAFSYAQAGWAILLFLALFSSGTGGNATLRAAIVREYFGVASFGKVLGIIMGASAIGGIIGPALAGWAFDTTGSYHLIWLAFSGLAIVSIATILMVKPEKALTLEPRIGRN